MENFKINNRSNITFIPKGSKFSNNIAAKNMRPDFTKRKNNTESKTIFAILSIATMIALGYILTKGRKIHPDTPQNLPNKIPQKANKDIKSTQEAINETTKPISPQHTKSGDLEKDTETILQTNQSNLKTPQTISPSQTDTSSPLKPDNISEAAKVEMPKVNPTKASEQVSPAIPASNTQIFTAVRGEHLGFKHTANSELFFFSNGITARPNLRDGSFFSTFKRVPVLSDEVAAKRFKQAKTAIKNEFGEKSLMMKKTISPIFTDGGDDIDCIYNAIRYANYSEAQTIMQGTKDYKKIISTKTPGMADFQIEGWYYRGPLKQSYTQGKCRISLDAKIDEELIKKLDKYILDNRLNAIYKVPLSLQKACHRADTYTIYFCDELTPKIQQDICEIAKPYIRQGYDVHPVGEILQKGVYYQREPKVEDTRDFIKTLFAINPNLAKTVIRNSSYYKWNSNLSAGQIEAAKIFLSKLLTP